jgi:multicomponent K+:H+ antiporter subunit E
MSGPERNAAAGPGWLPHPVLSLLLVAAWLLLQQSLAPAQLLWAGVLALVLPRLLHGFLGDRVRVRAPGTMLRLAGVVLWDIVVSNLAVARLVLDPRATPQPAWVDFPLQATHPTALALLATIITITPGTVSCVVDEVRGVILIHALDCDDGDALVALVRQRYERPLRRIFEGADA